MIGWGGYIIHVWAFDPSGPDGSFDSIGPDGVFGTDDDYTLPDSVDSGLSDFRSYRQVTRVTGLEAPWGGSATVRVILEEQPSLLGVISWIDMYGNQRSLPWAQVIETTPGSTWASSATGSYRLWFPEGTHEFFVTTIGEEQFWEQKLFPVVLSGSGFHVFADILLVPSGIVTPEFGAPIALLMVSLIVPLILLLRRRVGTVPART